MDPRVKEIALARAGDFVGVVLFAAGGGYLAWRIGAAAEGEVQVLQVGACLASAVAGFLWLEIRQTRRELRRLHFLLDDVRFGAGTERDRDAVDILVRAVEGTAGPARETALRTLRKISGMEFGDDPRAWREWWTAARATFVRPGPRGPQK
jgi:hypothetical protein